LHDYGGRRPLFPRDRDQRIRPAPAGARGCLESPCRGPSPPRPADPRPQTIREGLAADLLQMQPNEILGSLSACRPAASPLAIWRGFCDHPWRTVSGAVRASRRALSDAPQHEETNFRIKQNPYPEGRVERGVSKDARAKE